MSIFSSLLAIVATARLIPQDIEDRTIYSILAKPVPRFEYLIGRLGGTILLLAISLLAMSVAFVLVLYTREQAVLHETARQMSATPGDQLAQALQAVRGSAFNHDLFSGIAVIYAKACLLAALTLFVSTFATTNLFTVVVMVFIYFIGHLQSTAREYWLHEHGADWITRLFLAFVALVFPDLQTFNFVDEIVVGTAIPTALFLKTVGLGAFYVVLYTSLAGVVFSGKEL
jgi:ABC-type Na+ efflux pump permease subunit